MTMIIYTGKVDDLRLGLDKPRGASIALICGGLARPSMIINFKILRCRGRYHMFVGQASPHHLEERALRDLDDERGLPYDVLDKSLDPESQCLLHSRHN